MSYPQANRTPRWRTIARRLVIVPLTVVAAVLIVASLPITIVLAALVDIGFRRWSFGTVRILLFAVWYLVIAVGVQVVGLSIWLVSGFGVSMRSDRIMVMNYGLIRQWIRLMLLGLRMIVGLRLEIDNPGFAVGPSVIVARHQSLADVFIPTGIAIVDNRTWIRVVLTAGLVNEPSLDLIAHRTPQYFIQRGAKDMRAEVEALVRLGEHADENTGLVIFAEGGLFREERREQVLASLQERDPIQAERGRRLRHLLPPKSTGFSALLDGAPTADVVVVGHVGFEQLTDPATIWRSVPLQHGAKITLSRHDRADVPDEAVERRDWLNDRWDEMDAWIHDELQAR